MNTEHQQPDDESLQAPAKLVSALQHLPRQRPAVPSALNEAILRQAREHLEDRRKMVSFPRRQYRQWLAVAASIIILGTVLFLSTRPDQPASPNRQFARDDINQDGQVDILDAMALSLQLEHGTPQNNRDLNGDGVVDDKDAEVIAQKVVQLSGGHRS